MGALGGLAQGLANGLEMRRQFQLAADQHQEFLQRTAQQQQTMQQQQHDASIKNIMDRMNLEMSGALPVNNGMVTDTSQSAPQSQPAAAADPQSAPPQQAPNFTPANYSPAPLDMMRSAVAPPAQQPAPQPAAAPGPYLRKADKSRLVSVPNPDGTKNEYELLTPQAQMQRTAQMQEAAASREKLNLAKADDAVRQFYLQRRGQKLDDATAKTLGVDNTNPRNLFLPEEIVKMTGDAAGIAQKTAEIGKSKADAGLTTAQTGGAQAESDIKTQQAEFMKNMKPEDLDAQVDAVVPPGGDTAALNARTKARAHFSLGAGQPMDKILEVIKEGADQIGKTETAVRTAQATAPIKINVATSEAAGKNALAALSPEALANAATAYRTTGVMPALGMGNAQLRAQIMNAAGAMGPLDIASNASAFKANQGSLASLQKQADANQAFENTAGRNLDLFLAQAKGVVDSGSPWINSPLRTLAKGAVGSASQAAYDTARQVATNEIAKVVTSLSGSGQLSDSARKEVDAFNPQSATLEQTYRVAEVLRQDMANRTQGYHDQIADITSRISGKPAATTAPPMPATLAASDVGKVYLSKSGQTLKITAVNPNDGTQFQSQVVQK